MWWGDWIYENDLTDFLDMCKWPKNSMKTPEEIQTGCVVDEFYFLFFEILLFTMSIDKDSKYFLDI